MEPNVDGASSRLDPDFEQLLADHRIDDLDAHDGVVYGVFSDFRLGYLNPAGGERPCGRAPARPQGPPNEADLATYADPNGLLTQCSGCRRMRNYRVAGRWDWIPEWVETPPPGVSHTFCPACFGHYFPAADLEEPALGLS